LHQTTALMTMPTQLPASSSGSVTELLARLRVALEPFQDLKLALLFGSLAQGRGRPDSDVDLAVQAGRPLSAEERMDLIVAVSQALQRPVDLVDLRTAGEPTLGQVVRHGRRILGSDASHGRLLYRQLVDQADFMPLRNRILKERRVAWTGK
jgi:predicted nucleotidyltransferase